MKHNKIKIIIPILILTMIVVSIWLVTQDKTFYYAGTIEARPVTLSARVASVIESFLAQEGNPVKKDEVLVTLAGEDIKLNAAIAEKDFIRGKKLFANGSLPLADFDKLRFQRDRTALLVKWCTIISPISGVVMDTYREPGEIVGPGMQLLTVGNLSEVWAVIYVEQPMLVQLSIGQKVTGILPELPGRSLPGIITVIKNKAEFTPRNVQTRKERTRLVYGVKVVFKNPDGLLKPGMTIEVKLPEP